MLWQGRADHPARPPQRSATCPRSAASTPSSRSSTSSSTSPSSRAWAASTARAQVQDLLERFGLGGPRQGPPREALAGQPAAGADHRLGAAAAGGADPRRALLRASTRLAVDSMVDLLREYTRDGIPVLFSSHQLDLVERLCDRLVVLAQGRRVAAGTVSELRDAGVPRFRLVARRRRRLGPRPGRARRARPRRHDRAGRGQRGGRRAAPHRRGDPSAAPSTSSSGSARRSARSTGRPRHEHPRTRPLRRTHRAPTGGHRAPEPAWLLVTRREIVSRITDKSFLDRHRADGRDDRRASSASSAWQDGRPTRSPSARTPDAVAIGRRAVVEARPQVDDQVEVTARRAGRRGRAAARSRPTTPTPGCTRSATAGSSRSESSEQDSLTDVVAAWSTPAGAGRNAAAAGTTVEALEAGSDVSTPPSCAGDAEKAAVADAVGFVFVFLFYFAALVFGMQLASSVIEEKQSRIVEIIAAAIPLRHLLAGKVLGNTALAVIQLLVYLVVGLVGLSFTPYKSYVPGAVGPGRVVHRLLPRRLHRARLPVGGGGVAGLAHRGPPGHLDAADDADAGDVLRRALPRRPRSGDRARSSRRSRRS